MILQTGLIETFPGKITFSENIQIKGNLNRDFVVKKRLSELQVYIWMLQYALS